MNARGVEVLMRAALAGKPQARGMLHLGGANCALGELHEDLHGSHAEAVRCRESRFRCQEWAGGAPYGLDAFERGAIMEANDHLGWDFLTIARKFGTEEVPA